MLLNDFIFSMLRLRRRLGAERIRYEQSWLIRFPAALLLYPTPYQSAALSCPLWISFCWLSQLICRNHAELLHPLHLLKSSLLGLIMSEISSKFFIPWGYLLSGRPRNGQGGWTPPKGHLSMGGGIFDGQNDWRRGMSIYLRGSKMLNFLQSQSCTGKSFYCQYVNRNPLKNPAKCRRQEESLA